jgi:hypothetical protein
MPDVFIDYSNDGPDSGGQPSPDAAAGSVRYRKRPKDSGCQHEQVTFGTPHRGLVDCSCDGCGLEWRSVKVVEL